MKTASKLKVEYHFKASFEALEKVSEAIKSNTDVLNDCVLALTGKKEENPPDKEISSDQHGAIAELNRLIDLLRYTQRRLQDATDIFNSCIM